ncbi:MAG: glycosyltransferase family 4 protein [Bacteroides sp.]|nr:glycosyltransferase family 4 protein [Bacteroides sp.]
MKTRHIYIVMKEDLVYYPPIISLISILLKLGLEVVCLCIYSDSQGKKVLTDAGARFVDVGEYDLKGNVIKKFGQLLSYRNKVLGYFRKNTPPRNSYIWIAQNENVKLFGSLIEKYPTIIHQLEFTSPRISWKYWLMNPFASIETLYGKADKVVCCEYNRAQITRGLYNLKALPYVLPNKTLEPDMDNLDTPADEQRKIDSIIELSKTKKIILYQGVFSSKERRLEEFCQAFEYLPADYAMVVMGKGSSYFEELRKKYDSDRIRFIPFIRPPHYLKVTRVAYIGVLSYFPSPSNIGSVINPLYCAPNKIFEYARFGIPMIANDIPGLHYIFQEFKCGLTIPFPMSPRQISEGILRISGDYGRYSEGAKEFNRSVDVEKTISEILESEDS